MEYGYVRVSTREQNAQRQMLALKEYGIEKTRIFMDKQSGKDFERPNYKKMIRKLKSGDTLASFTAASHEAASGKIVIDRYDIAAEGVYAGVLIFTVSVSEPTT